MPGMKLTAWSLMRQPVVSLALRIDAGVRGTRTESTWSAGKASAAFRRHRRPVGFETTLVAMLEKPDAFTAASWLISRRCSTIRSMRCAPRIKGVIRLATTVGPGRIWTLQSDLCCMLAADLPRPVLEELREEAKHVDYAFII